jgi:zinc protease
MVVVIAGDVGATEARAAVERHFGAAPRSRLAPVLVPAEPLQLGPRSVHRYEKVEVTRAALAWPIPGLTDPSAPVLDILALVLGGGESSVLWRKVREELKLVHTIDASSWNPGSSGLFCITFTCDAGKREEAQGAVLRILSSLAVPGAFTPGQVRKAFRQSVVGEINSCKTMSGQASRLGMAEVVVGDLDFSRTYFDRLGRVRPGDLGRALRANLTPDRLISVSLEPQADGPAEAKGAPASLGGRPDFEEVVLPNGARLLFQQDRRLPNLHLRLLTHGGPLCEAPHRRGSSSLLATLLTKDTRRRSAAGVAQRIEEVGGTFSSFAGDNTLGMAAEVLPPDTDRALGLIADGALAPAFSAGTLGNERDAQLAGLKEENDDVVAFARRLLRRKFFGAHAFAIGPQGDEEGVAACSAADLSALWKLLLVGPGVVLSVAGDFDPDKLVPKLEAFLKRIPRGAPPGAGRGFAGPAAPGDFVETQPREQAVVLQGFPGPTVGAPDYHTGDVADELFSGMASRLFERVRDQLGLAYFVRSGRLACRSTAMFYFMAGTQPGKEQAVLDEIAVEIARVQAGEVSPEELRRCQVRLKAGARKALQANSSRAMQSAVDVIMGRPANQWKRYDSLIDAVTVADLASFAQTYLQKAKRTQLVVRP